jgi:hypothetical protein
LQASLTIGAVDDAQEREAERVADAVLSAPTRYADGGVASSVSEVVARASGPDGRSAGTRHAVPASVAEALAGAGAPLAPALRHDMEFRFGQDFSQVRLHAGEAAERSARDVRARAYTVGHDIVFAAGRLAPGTPEGRRLLAHELTHVLQQSGDRESLVGKPAGAPVLQRAATVTRNGMVLSAEEIAADPAREKMRVGTGERSAKVCHSVNAGGTADNCPVTLKPGQVVTIVADTVPGFWMQISSPDADDGFKPGDKRYVMAAFVKELPVTAQPAAASAKATAPTAPVHATATPVAAATPAVAPVDAGARQAALAEVRAALGVAQTEGGGVGDFPRAFAALEPLSLENLVAVLRELARSHETSVLAGHISEAATAGRINAALQAAILLEEPQASLTAESVSDAADALALVDAGLRQQILEMMIKARVPAQMVAMTLEGLAAMMASASPGLNPALAGVRGPVGPGSQARRLRAEDH